MSNILRSLGQNLSKSIKKEDLSPKQNIEKPQVVNEYTDPFGNISIGYDSVYMESLIKQQIPVDVWSFDNWRNFFKQSYESVFNKPFIFTKKQFNFFFSTLVIEGRNNYELSNDEIRDFLVWISEGYMLYLKKNDRPFNLNNIRYKLPDFFEKEILPKIERENILNIRMRNFPIDRSNIKLSIDEYFNVDPSILTKQLGFIIMLHYTQKFVYDGDIKEAYKFLIREIDKRCQFEKHYNDTIDIYMDELLKNTIYLGPYSFEERLYKEVPSWRTTFNGYISSRDMSNKKWWMNTYLPREPLKCVEEFSKKKVTSKKNKDIEIL